MTEQEIKEFQTGLSKTYGGKVYMSDFETDYSKPACYITNRIVADWSFDKTCKKQTLIRDGNDRIVRTEL